MMKTSSTKAVDCNSIVFMTIAIKLDQTVYLCLTDDRWLAWVFLYIKNFNASHKTNPREIFPVSISGTQSHLIHYWEPPNPLFRAIHIPSVVRCVCRILNSTYLANWRCFFMRDLKRILELRFENHSQREIARMLKSC